MILIGLDTKNAILIVEFANQLCHQGMVTGAVIIEASVLRRRPHPDDVSAAPEKTIVRVSMEGP